MEREHLTVEKIAKLLNLPFDSIQDSRFNKDATF